MSKKKILGISALVILIIPVSLVLTGCPHIDSLYGLKVAGDGAGGAIAMYEDKLGGSIYVQKISPTGETMWGEKGVSLGSSNSKSYGFVNFNIISDGAGGAIVAWPDPSQDQFRPSSHLARIDAGGKLLWQRDFIFFNRMISGGSGGAIIAFDYYPGIDITGNESQALTLVKVDTQGDYPWGLQGVAVPRQNYMDNTLQMTGDGSGGVIAVWEEKETLPGAMPGNARNICRLFTQRAGSDGQLAWGDGSGNGTLVYEFPEDVWIESFQCVEDGAGGVILTWFQVTEDPSAEAGHRQKWDIVVQRIDANGNIVWQPGGVPFEITKADPTALPMGPAPVGDGSGGAMVIWRDTRHDAEGEASIYAQKVDGQGSLLWQAGGVKVSSTSLNPHPCIVSDSSGGAIISYSFREDGKQLNIQRLEGDGQNAWPTNGVTITKSGYSSQFTAPDGQGGVIVAWGVGRSMFSPEKAYVQRVSPEGQRLWEEAGIRLGK
jgi:hypothetical protein